MEDMEYYLCDKCKDNPNRDPDCNWCFNDYMRESRKKIRDKKVNVSIKFLEKNKIPFTKTNTENIVKTDYWGDVFYISLKTFKIKKEGSNVWVQKKKKLIKPISKVDFGQYNGLSFIDIFEKDKNYLIWVNDKTDLLFDNKLYELIKKQ